MRRVAALVSALLLATLAAGCGRDSGADAVPPGLDAEPDAVEWRGSLPCADCESIDTRLVLLRRDDGERVYALVEVYVALDGSMRFEERGHWQVDRSLLSLEPEGGGLRRYRVVQGGALQVRDPDGRLYPGREHDLLLPAGGHP